MKGKITKISGPVVHTDVEGAINDVVRVGKEELLGEIIEINKETTTVQVYEETTGIQPGEPVKNTGSPLSVTLGPGILGKVYDGTQRPLQDIKQNQGIYIKRGTNPDPIEKDKKWEFKPTIENGQKVKPGTKIGEVKENNTITHNVLIPPHIEEGKIEGLKQGLFTVTQTIATVKKQDIKLAHEWPVRKPRPVQDIKSPTTPLVTGQRVLDFLFPLPKGGVAAIPGPFGAGKTVTQQQLAKWCDADIIVYIGCGERGNEMTEVLETFPELKDPKTGEPLMNRTVLIANTSNMPVAAREASIYTGVTIAEYYRDQGYDVALMADSTSRWAEAMREISGRLEELPGEEGFPSYLNKRLAQFYQRAGAVQTKNDENASITVVGAVSPPGGDFSEPVTQNTLRIVKAFYALDASLANKRHYPSIDWLQSYSLYKEDLETDFIHKTQDDWPDLRKQTSKLLQEEKELQDIVQLVGREGLPDEDRIKLEIARLIREEFLQQNAFHPVDTFCPLKKQYHIIKTIHDYKKALEQNNIDVDKLYNTKTEEYISGLNTTPNEEYQEIEQKRKEAQQIIKETIKEIQHD